MRVGDAAEQSARINELENTVHHLNATATAACQSVETVNHGSNAANESLRDGKRQVAALEAVVAEKELEVRHLSK